MDINRPRHDGYFEAVIIKPRKGGTIRVYVTLIGKSGNIREDIKGFPYMNIDIYYQVVGREDYHIDKQRIRLTGRRSTSSIGSLRRHNNGRIRISMCSYTYSYR